MSFSTRPAHLAASPTHEGGYRYGPQVRNRVLTRAFAIEHADKELIEQCSLRVAYRITRELARMLNLITYDSALSSLNFQECALRQRIPNTPAPTDSRSAFQLLEQIREEGPRHFGVVRYDKDKHSDPNSSDDNECVAGIAISPHSRHMNKQLRRQFKMITNAIMLHLNIPEGGKDDPEYGKIAFKHLDPLGDPKDFPYQSWPDMAMLFVYEGLLIDEILGDIIEHGQHHARRILIDVHGFRPHEIRGLMRLAKLEARDRMEADIEEDRAILSIRLEDLIERAKQSLDLRVELGALKQLAIVQGVTRAEPEDATSAFVNTVKKVANEASNNSHILPPASSSGREIVEQGNPSTPTTNQGA